MIITVRACQITFKVEYRFCVIGYHIVPVKASSRLSSRVVSHCCCSNDAEGAHVGTDALEIDASSIDHSSIVYKCASVNLHLINIVDKDGTSIGYIRKAILECRVAYLYRVTAIRIYLEDC